MASIRTVLRKGVAWTHLWLGVITGLGVCILGVTGTIVTFRPQLGVLLSPPADRAGTCSNPVDWNQAQKEIERTANSTINRIYFPADVDPRYHFRMMTAANAIYTHVIYDACTGHVLGTANLQWLDWLVEVHHNLLAGKTGRQFVGAIGLALFFSGIGGILLWLLSRPNLKRAFRLNMGAPLRRTTIDLHRASGIAGACLLLLQAFTGLWLCYPQPLRAALDWVAPTQLDARPAKVKTAKGAAAVGLNALIVSAERAIPDGRIREIRMPDGNGTVQVRMWRPGDFRSLGDNIVSLDRVSAQVQTLDLYSTKPASNRFVQAMTSLHYGDWGGIIFRTIYGLAGLVTVPLFLTGILYWWLGRRRKPVVVPASKDPNESLVKA